MIIRLSMPQYRSFAAKHPEAHRDLVQLEMDNDLESLRRRGKKGLLNELEFRRLTETEEMLRRKATRTVMV